MYYPIKFIKIYHIYLKPYLKPVTIYNIRRMSAICGVGTVLVKSSNRKCLSKFYSLALENKVSVSKRLDRTEKIS